MVSISCFNHGNDRIESNQIKRVHWLKWNFHLYYLKSNSKSNLGIDWKEIFSRTKIHRLQIDEWRTRSVNVIITNSCPIRSFCLCVWVCDWIVVGKIQRWRFETLKLFHKKRVNKTRSHMIIIIIIEWYYHYCGEKVFQHSIYLFPTTKKTCSSLSSWLWFITKRGYYFWALNWPIISPICSKTMFWAQSFWNGNRMEKGKNLEWKKKFFCDDPGTEKTLKELL